MSVACRICAAFSLKLPLSLQDLRWTHRCQLMHTHRVRLAMDMTHVLRLAGHGAHVDRVSTNGERSRCHFGWPYPFPLLSTCVGLHVLVVAMVLHTCALSAWGTRLATAPPLHDGSTGTTPCMLCAATCRSPPPRSSARCARRDSTFYFYVFVSKRKEAAC